MFFKVYVATPFGIITSAQSLKIPCNSEVCSYIFIFLATF
ncbi:hypothetical protein PanWU01x14_039700 [Parasponia andersonii]|uniref:Uncharacterized protein n=1 Tax=Parasponia andersonii TaxID=3476 RepID=A0A2P5DQZ7_PARAD|nr:hypothetical protein PanWU01x14_039700 [Parasponia andersonii]